MTNNSGSNWIASNLLPWNPSWETSKNILNVRFVSIPTKNPKLYHVYTHFAVSVWRIMLEPATNKESSVVQSVKRKSICPRETVSKVYRAVFSTTVCWVSLPFDKLATEVTLLVPNVRKTTLRCIIALIVDDLCAQTVTTHTKCWASRSKDTKPHQSSSLKQKITKPC